MSEGPAPQERAPHLGTLGAQGVRDLLWLRRLIFPVYLVNLAVALFALLPTYLALARLTAHRPVAARLAHTWDLSLLAEIALDHPALMNQLEGVFLFVPVAYLVLSQAVLGGVLGALDREAARPTLRAFGRDAFARWLRLLALLLWSGLPYGVAAGVLLAGWSLAAGTSFAVRLLAATPGLLLLLVADTALDCARVVAARSPARAAWRALLSGYRVLVCRPLSGLALHLGYGALGFGLVAGLVFLPDSWDAGSNTALLATLLVRQAFVVGRVALRVASLGAHRALVWSVLGEPVGQGLEAGESA